MPHFLLLTNVYPKERVPSPLGRLEVVDLVVDLEPPDASHESRVRLQEVLRVAEGPGAAQEDGLRERDAGEQALENKCNPS